MCRLVVVLCVAGCGRLHFDEMELADDAPVPTSQIVELTHRGSAPCVRSNDGRMACWGENENGQLGRGTISAFEEPELVPLEHVVDIQTGENTTFAIDADGALWAWGDNGNGQLGLGMATTAETVPRRVDLPPVVAVTAGQFHSCALTAAGEAYCWGDNGCGQLGTGTPSASVSPARVLFSGATQIAVADRQTCLLDPSGTMYCMGSPHFDGGGACVNPRMVPTVMNVPPIVRINGGCHLEACAIDNTGDAWCWGENRFGQVGDGTVVSRQTPTPVMNLSNAVQIAGGYDATCAATSSNEVFCWGRNPDGQLGIGDSSTTSSLAPMKLPFFTGAIEIDQLEVGCNTACVRSGTDIYCWGANDEGIVDTTGISAYGPVLRPGLPF